MKRFISLRIAKIFPNEARFQAAAFVAHVGDCKIVILMSPDLKLVAELFFQVLIQFCRGFFKSLVFLIGPGAIAPRIVPIQSGIVPLDHRFHAFFHLG